MEYGESLEYFIEEVKTNLVITSKFFDYLFLPTEFQRTRLLDKGEHSEGQWIKIFS